MEARVTITATVAEMDLIRRALYTHRTIENEVLSDKGGKTHEDVQRRQVARIEVVQTTDLLNKLGWSK